MKKIIACFLIPIFTYAATYTVNSNTDTGAGAGTTGDLRFVMGSVNATSDLNPIINFDLPGGSTTITLTAPLPAITATSVPTMAIPTGNNSVVIDGLDTFPGIYMPGFPVTVDIVDAPTSLTIRNCPVTPLAPWSGVSNNFTGVFDKTGAGTLLIETTTTSENITTSGVFTNIEGGAIIIDGPLHSTTPTPTGLLFEAPFGKDIKDDAIFGKRGSVTSFSPINVQSGGTLFAEGGFLNFDTTVNFLPGLDGPAVLRSTITDTDVGTVVLESFTFSNADFRFGQLELEIPTPLSSTPTVYVPFLTKNGEIIKRFPQVLVNGVPDKSNIFYSPQNAPNAILFTTNVDEGISSADIVFGDQVFPSIVLSDPCAGLVVVSLLTPAQQAAALAGFFTNQSSLTIQALGGITTSINKNSIRRRQAQQGASTGSPLAAWNNMHSLIADANFKGGRTTNTEMALDEGMSLAPKENQFSFSVNAFGQFQDQEAVTTEDAFFSAFFTKSGGVTLGFDYLGINNILLGGAATYVYTRISQEKNLGSQNVQTILGTIYSSFIVDHLTMNLLVTGGYNDNNSVRNFRGIPGDEVVIPGIDLTFQSTGIPGGTAFGNYDSYQLAPHFDMSYEIPFGFISLLPFIQSDLVVNLQESFVETGNNFFVIGACGEGASLNLATDYLTSYMLQNEAGINLFEQIDLKAKGLFVFRQKGSYVNRYTIPYTLRSKFAGSTVFTETPIEFPMQHFFGFDTEMIYRLNDLSVVFAYEGMYGSGYIFNALFLRLAKDF